MNSQVTLNLINCASIVAVISTLITISTLFNKIRAWLPESEVWYCPICLGIWVALPVTLLVSHIKYYFLIILLSNLFMLIIMKLYNELHSFEEK
jgi:hypothetical protein